MLPDYKSAPEDPSAVLGRISSHGFLVLAVVLHAQGYPLWVVSGQLLQYVLSVAVWLPPVHAGVLWADRCCSLAMFVGTVDVMSEEDQVTVLEYPLPTV